MIFQIVATFACGVFFGAAVYINLVEQPARISCGTHLAVMQWRPSYKRGTMMQVPLALIGSLSAFIAWRFDGKVASLESRANRNHEQVDTVTVIHLGEKRVFRGSREASFIYVYIPGFVEQGKGIGGNWVVTV